MEPKALWQAFLSSHKITKSSLMMPCTGAPLTNRCVQQVKR